MSEEVTANDALHYFVKQFNATWRERGLGELPRFISSTNSNGTVNFTVKKNGQSPFMTIEHDLTAHGKWPEHPRVDLQDGDQFYDLIDRFISDVI